MTSRTHAMGLATVLGLVFTTAAQAQEAPPDAAAPAPAPATGSADVSATAAAPEAPAAEATTAAPEEAAPASAPTPAPAPTEATEVKTEQAAAAAAPEEEEKPSLWPLEANTSTWSRGEIREGYDRLGVSRGRFQEGDHVVFRARLGLGTKPLKLTEDIQGQVYVAPQASGSWGTSGLGGTIGEANLGIYEGYFKFTSERFDFKAGRFAMNYGEAMVIGNLDWNEAGRAFDGAHGHYKMDQGYLDVFVTQTAEGWPTVTDPFLGGDSYFWGVYAGLGGYVQKGMDLDVYFLGLSDAASEGITDPTTGTVYDRDGATRFTLGARIKQKIAAFDYRVEGGIQFGETAGPVPAAAGDTANAVTTFAYMVDGQVGFSFSETIRLGVGGLVASGNDPSTTDNEAWNELYPTTHKFLGLMDVIGFRTNAASAYLNFNAGLTKSLSFILDGHLFSTLQANGLAQVGTDNWAGGEIDVQLLQKIGKWASVRGLYGVFLANGDHYVTDDAAHYGELQAGIVF